jgi:hypothetical protein
LAADDSLVYDVLGLGNFALGDRVRVVGVIPIVCYSFCMQGDACIREATIEPCLDEIPTVGEWGMIIFCALLFAWMAWVLVRRRRKATVGI